MQKFKIIKMNYRALGKIILFSKKSIVLIDELETREISCRYGRFWICQYDNYQWHSSFEVGSVHNNTVRKGRQYNENS
jgi:hypothetical protein